jgi:acetyltransferase-like isoleucine patch superfamily enzyme
MPSIPRVRSCVGRDGVAPSDRTRSKNGVMNNLTEFQPGRRIPLLEARRYLHACGINVKIYRGCRILSPEKVRVGDHTQIDENVFINAGAGVTLGRHVHLAWGCSITGGGECLIHDFAGIGAGVRLVTGTEITDGSSLTNPTIPEPYRQVKRGRIEIGAHALVFTNAIILPDVVIGEGALIAAGSVVHHDLKSWGIYAGNPLVQVGVRPSDTILRLAEKLRRESGGRKAKSGE